MSDRNRRLVCLLLRSRGILLPGCGILALALASVVPLIAQVDSTGQQSPATPRTPLSPFRDPFPYESGYRHSVEFDSLSNTVRLYETLFGERIGQPQILTLDEFLMERQREQEQQAWEERATRYEFNPATEKPDDLERIIGLGKQFELPIPQNPIFSIFGPPTISLNVNGSVNISAGWQWDNNNLTQISDLGSTQSAPFFNQNIQVNVTGKVGDKLKIGADFDNQRSIDFDNQLKIGFGGGPESDDDIIQSFEAGNVQLTTPSSLIGGSQALFGAKAGFKFGPLFLTTIASQKRGERKSVTVTGGSVKNQVSIKPYDYATNHFWLDTVYRGYYDEFFKSTPPAATPRMAPHNVTDIEVYEQVKDGSIPAQFRAIAYADLPPAGPSGRYPAGLSASTVQVSAGQIQRGFFRKLTQGADFDVDRQLGTLTIRSLQPDKAYAVAYRTNAGTFGEFSNARPDNDSIAVLKLIYVSGLQPDFKTLWTRQMKNIYPLQGVRNVDPTNSRIRITFGVPPDTSEVLKVEGSPRIVTVLGVDRRNSSDQPIPDGEFDIRSDYFFDKARGEIIFPSVEPFRQQLRQTLGASAEPYVLEGIYELTRDQAQRETKVSKYTIGGEISGSGGNRIQLGTPYVPPGSIKVFSNGEQLVEGVDYRADATFGEVTLLSPKANNASGNIRVEFEQSDFATIANKTLLGVRADYDLLNKRYMKSKLGMTLMRYNQSLPTDKVQISSGDESVSNLMVGFDGTMRYQANFLTKAIDALPIIDTKEPSFLTLNGEWAMVMPDPNSKPSLVASDLGKGAAYIDDFESGAKRQIQMGVGFTSWSPASPPVDVSVGATDSARLAHKGHFFWYNTTGVKPLTSEIWPKKDQAKLASTTNVLDLIYNPAERGVYNLNFDYTNQYVPGNPFVDSLWGGMMRSLSFYASNLNEENIDYIEITMKLEEGDPQNTRMFIDIGQVSEDVIPNFELNTEDGITANNPQPDDVLNVGEDVGLDSLGDAAEKARFGVSMDDPANDNYHEPTPYGTNDEKEYAHVNGQENNNIASQRAPRPDAEDLNGNRSIDLDNSYFTYQVDLNDNPLTNPQIVGGGDNPYRWRQYRIPIRTGYSVVGNPSFSNVQYVRVRFSGPRKTHVRIAEFNLVGSDWRNYSLPIDSTRDPKLDIAFVNVEDNSGPPDYYSIPPGVSQEVSKSDDVRKNEQSMAVTVNDLERGESRAALRVRPRAFDVVNYKQMKFFLHGGGDMDVTQIPGRPAKVFAFVRLGWDSLNYYEYRVPLLQGWNEYTVDFGALAAIKQEQTGTDPTAISYYPVPNDNTSGAQFALRGRPVLTRIQFIAFGVLNNAYPGALTTTMWVNELRVVGAEDGTDWAATGSAALKLADLGSVNVNATRTNPNFHRLEERFGNRVEASNWAMNSVFQLEKFLPQAFKGSSIPFTYNHTEQLEKPRFISQSDVEVNAAAERLMERTGTPSGENQRQADSLRLATQTLVTQDAFAFSSLRISFPGEAWWVRDIANKFTFGYEYNQRRERSPLVVQRFNWNWAFRGQYAVAIPQNFDLQPFKKLFEGVPVFAFWKDFRVNFLPYNFAANTTVNRSRTTEQLRDVPDPSPVVRDFSATRSAQFNWKLTEGGVLNVQTDYNLDVTSTLTNIETDAAGRQRTAGEISKDIFFKEGRLFNFGRDHDLHQSFLFISRPRIPLIPNIDRFVTPTARYSVKYDWKDELGQTTTAGTYTKSAQWNSTGQLGLAVRLSSIGDAIFGKTPAAGDSAAAEGTLASILRYLIKIPLLDFEQVQFNFKQDNTTRNPGVVGSTGVSNLWGRTLLFRSESPDFGPGAAYQLGLTSDPHGKLNFRFGSAFPFIHVDQERGIRAPNIYVQDDFTQKNNLTASTTRGLWPGASLTLNWGVEFGYNKNYSVLTDANGFYDSLRNVRMTTNLNRTYLSLPNFLFFSVFNNDIEGVVDEYARAKAEIIEPQLTGATAADTARYQAALLAYTTQITNLLSTTFEEQLEAFNWLPGEISRYLPRMNWNFQWNGLENLPFLKSFAQSASLHHAYTGRFVRNSRESDQGSIPETQTVARGFSPLVQFNITGKPDVFNGTATGSVSYNTTTNFALITAARSEISKELRNELQVQLSYQRRGMKLPIFGLQLKNDIEFSTTFSYARSNRKRFNLTEFKPEGNNDGSTTINLRPSIRYSLSNTVTASAFLSYDATIPDEDGSRDISRSTTKVGIDLRVGISGGR